MCNRAEGQAGEPPDTRGRTRQTMKKQRKKALKGMARKVVSWMCWGIVLLLIPVLEIMFISTKIMDLMKDEEDE